MSEFSIKQEFAILLSLLFRDNSHGLVLHQPLPQGKGSVIQRAFTTAPTPKRRCTDMVVWGKPPNDPRPKPLTPSRLPEAEAVGQAVDRNRDVDTTIYDRSVTIVDEAGNPQVFIVTDEQVQKKLARHGPDLGLPIAKDPNGNPKLWRMKTPDGVIVKYLSPNGKPYINLFHDNLQNFISDPNNKQYLATFRRGRFTEDPKFVQVFYNKNTGCIAIFSNETRKFMSFWQMTAGQILDFELYGNVS